MSKSLRKIALIVVNNKERKSWDVLENIQSMLERFRSHIEHKSKITFGMS